MNERKGFDPKMRGYLALYRPNQVNHCPGCGRTHWYVGRITAECGFCSVVLSLEEQRPSAASIIRRGKGGGKVSRMALA